MSWAGPATRLLRIVEECCCSTEMFTWRPFPQEETRYVGVSNAAHVSCVSWPERVRSRRERRSPQADGWTARVRDAGTMTVLDGYGGCVCHLVTACIATRNTTLLLSLASPCLPGAPHSAIPRLERRMSLTLSPGWTLPGAATQAIRSVCPAQCSVLYAMAQHLFAK